MLSELEKHSEITTKVISENWISNNRDYLRGFLGGFKEGLDYNGELYEEIKLLSNILHYHEMSKI